MIDQSPSPDVSTFRLRAGTARLIPVWRRIIADLDTPLTLFCKLIGGREEFFLFESMEGGEKWGRYSFIGIDPILSISSHNRKISVNRLTPQGRVSDEYDGHPYQELRRILGEFRAFNDPELPRFCGGMVGYLGYDMVRFFEDLPAQNEAGDAPDMGFMVPGMVLVHDSLKQELVVVDWVDTAGLPSLEAGYHQSVARIEQAITALRAPTPLAEAHLDGGHEEISLTSNLSAPQFHDMVERAKEYIRAGDIFQVVLSQRFGATTGADPLTIYRALRHTNPSPYLFYLKCGDLVQIGSSPEILVRKENESIEVRPIAGTRPRGATPERDRALEEELLADPKERSEHLMLVDLGRNDIGRVARGGSVEVRDLLVIERYSHVMHIVSGVHGLIDPDYDQFDVLAACFPAGTLSGAPKIRAMEIIEELEPCRRGPYGGAVGYFGFSGNMDFCITIRTIFIRGDDVWMQAGAGIVADSDPRREYEETVNKSMALHRALELAGG
jgi:anthranilate synthase component 1